MKDSTSIFSRKFKPAALAAALPLLLGGSLAHAQNIIDWGGTDYVGGANDATHSFDNYFLNPASADASGYGGFDGSNPMQLSPSTGYTGARIFGKILELENPGNAFGDKSGIVNNTAGDYIILKGDEGTEQTTGFLILWDQADFLVGGTGDVTFDADSALHVSMSAFAGQTANSGRLVVRQGEDYYVSEALGFASGVNTVDALGSLGFTNYDPASSLNGFGFGPVVSGDTFTGITEVGLYFEGNGTNVVRLQEFKVTAVIPEPGTYAMLLGGACLLLATQRRRLRKA